MSENSMSQKLEQVCRVEPLPQEYLGYAASLLYQSYHDDPLFMEIFNAENADYDKRLRMAIREELNVFWQANEPTIGIFVGNQLFGVACVVCPGFGLSVGRFWHWRLKMLMTVGFVSTRQMIEKEGKLKAAMPAKRYHMLAYMAVHPNHQQHGLGNMLIKAVDEIVDQENRSEGIGVYVTLNKYLDFFNNDNYKKVSDVNVGYVKGELLFRRSGASTPQ
ncbi:MAG: GNAT superfamily N-acetyltransferase [Alteromonadaceae bacterium]|jgi:GNAT superfamily N-acetyltransferase